MVGSWDELEARARQRMYRIEELGEQMHAVRERVTSAEGAVTVEVDGNGALVDLRFSDEISRMSPDDFERAVVDAGNEAVREAFARRAELIASLAEEFAPRQAV
ncbi:YbaB/EbfC family nucleoid-associated protein [Nocardia sp. NPDC058666]|uniref:YbaB/EbfC family nucleoid-associated protein n=1 Tax=unclassified Nocardia TaxID=2637762 RepID=UPI003648C869